FGIVFQQRPILLGWTNQDSGQLASLYVQLLTALATPLIFFAIVDAFVQTNISGRQGIKMFCICGFNVIIAFIIGLTILNVWQPGQAWKNQFAHIRASEQVEEASVGSSAPPVLENSKNVSLSPLEILRSYTPKSIAQPFVENMVL